MAVFLFYVFSQVGFCTHCSLFLFVKHQWVIYSCRSTLEQKTLDGLFYIADNPEITTHPLSEMKEEGQNATLSCNADGNPVPAISWIRNGFPIDTAGNSGISFSEDKQQLTITNVSRTDSGEYRCVANNSIGNATSDVANLDIQCNVCNFIPSCE